jgi:uncharacterized SAM-binding protein YcdF (DUF218 family)
MFFILSKTLFYLIMPATWMLALLLWAVFSNKNRKKIVIALTCIFLFFTNGYVANKLLHLWEFQPIPVKQVKHHQLAVILTGVTNYGQEPYDRVYFNRGADRILHPLQLYRMGKIDKILITGGTTPAKDTVLIEALQLRQVLLYAGVDSNDIYIEPKAINTRENALFSAPIIKKMVGDTPILLVTSAFHMRRSLACFAKVGVKCDPYPVDFRITNSIFGMAHLIPTFVAYTHWEMMVHEIFGYFVYKVMGYS